MSIYYYDESNPTFPCRAWVRFTTVNANNAVQTINGSGNVSSVVRDRETNYVRVYFTTPFPSNKYAAIVSSIPMRIFNVTQQTCSILGNLTTDYVEVGVGVGGNSASSAFDNGLKFHVAVFW